MLWVKEGEKADPTPLGAQGPHPMETPCVGEVSPPGHTPARGPSLDERVGGSSVRSCSSDLLGSLVHRSGPGASLARLESDVSSPCSSSWTPSTPTRLAGCAETSTASPPTTSSSRTVSSPRRLPVPYPRPRPAPQRSLKPASRIPSQRCQSEHVCTAHMCTQTCALTRATHMCRPGHGPPPPPLQSRQPPPRPPVKLKTCLCPDPVSAS